MPGPTMFALPYLRTGSPDVLTASWTTTLPTPPAAPSTSRV